MWAFVHLLMCTLLPALVGPVGGEVVVAGTDTGRGGGGGGPEFVPRQGTATRAPRGDNVTLECLVLNLGDKAVSWVRSRDLQILSHGGAVFTADARVSVPPPSHAPSHTSAHALSIARLRESDAGRYECQLNTEPKMSLFFDLIVLDEADAAAVLASSTEAAPDWAEESIGVWAVQPVVLAVAGGPAELACAARVVQTAPRPAPPLDIRWLRDGKPLVLQDGCAISRLAESTYAESRLRLSRATPGDAGRYACAVGDHSASATLRLVVSDADNVREMEAMQRDESAGAGAAVGRLLSAACLLAILLAHFTAL